MCKRKISFSGISLLEFLLSLTIGSLILLALWFAIIAHYKNNNKQNALNEIQQNAAQVTYILNKAIRNSGVYGCNVKFQNSIHGNKNILTLIKTFPLMGMLSQQTAQSVLVGAKPNFHANDVIFITDCLHHETATILQVIHLLHKQKLMLARELNYIYSNTAQIARINVIQYYVKKAKRANQWHQPIFALYQREANHKEEELVQGVEEIRFQYDEIINNYLITKEPSEVYNWENVKGVSMQFNLAATSATPIRKTIYSHASIH